MESVSMDRLKRRKPSRSTKPGKKGGIVRGAGDWRDGNPMAYKIPLENIETAIHYGWSNNRHDLYEFDHDTAILSLTGLKATPEHTSHVRVAEYNLQTQVFTALVWDDVVRSLKQTVTQFLIAILSVYEVEEIVGPPGFLRKWQPRLTMRKNLRNDQSWRQNDYYSKD